jgi:hypothetical protein
VEQQAALRADALAFVGADRSLTYRELNHRANAVARALIACGFKRQSVAVVRMPCPSDSLIAMLAVWKAGGAYICTSTDDVSWPEGISIVERAKGGEARCRLVDVTRVLEGGAQPCPNLPILTRDTEVAYVMPRDGGPDVLVPHATISALRSRQPEREVVEWNGEVGGLDVWMALMTGATVLETAAPETAAA